MNHIDIILAIPLAIGAITGFSRGFIFEIASLFGLVAGLIIAALFAEEAGNILLSYVDWNPAVIKIVAFIAVFVGVMIIVRIIARAIEKLFKVAGLNFLNRIAGMGAGTLKYAFFISIFLILFNHLNKDDMFMSEEARRNSFLYEKIEILAPSILPGKSLFKYKSRSDELKDKTFVNKTYKCAKLCHAKKRDTSFVLPLKMSFFSFPYLKNLLF